MMYSIGIMFRHMVVIINTIHLRVFYTRGVTLHLVWHLYTVQCSGHRKFNNSYNVRYTVQNNTCWFSLSVHVCEYTVDICSVCYM